MKKRINKVMDKNLQMQSVNIAGGALVPGVGINGKANGSRYLNPPGYSAIKANYDLTKAIQAEAEEKEHIQSSFKKMKRNREAEDLDNLPLVDSSDEEGEKDRGYQMRHLQAIRNLNFSFEETKQVPV